MNDDKITFPLLDAGIKEDLLERVYKILAPNGFKTDNLGKEIVARQSILKSDITAVMTEVRNFCHNERVRMLTEIKGLLKHFSEEKQLAAERLRVEKSKGFLKYDGAAVRVLEKEIERLDTKVNMLALTYNIVNR